jgi:serine/threonine protein kinase
MEAEKYCPKCFKKYPPDAVDCPEDGQHLVSLMERDLVGEVLDDKYKVLSLVGRGGMGVVYKAEQHLIKRIVALKVVRREVIQDETAVKRFLNEARAIASLQCPQTVTLHDFGVSRDGLLYYTMELLKGRSLANLISEEAPLDYGRAAALILEACDSLQEAHEASILHRDLKPDNLFVITRFEQEHVKVLDFGIAKLMGDTSMDTVTETGLIIGTPKYLSPEQALGNECVPGSDLYSLGIVLYEMLTGSPPFVGDTALKTLWKHIQEPPAPIHIKNPNITVPKSIDRFLRKALQKKWGDRYLSAVEFRRDLKLALEDHDASPQTVTLRPLRTTPEGARVITESLERPEPGFSAEESAQSLMSGGGSPVAGKETVLEGAPRTEQAYPSLTEQKGTANLVSKEPTGGIPGKGTQALVRSMAGKTAKLVSAYIAAAIVVIIVLIIWAPWEGKEAARSAPSAATTEADVRQISPGVPPVAQQAAPLEADSTNGKSTEDVATANSTESGSIIHKNDEPEMVVVDPAANPQQPVESATVTAAVEPAAVADGEVELQVTDAKLEQERVLAAKLEARRLAEEVRKASEKEAAEKASAKARTDELRGEKRAREAARKRAAKKAEADANAKKLAEEKAAKAAEEAEDDDFSEFKE